LATITNIEFVILTMILNLMMMAYYKKIISLLLFVLTCGSMFGQGTINFELGENLDLIRIDSTTNPNNIWQIGTPQKTIFDSGYMTSRAMLTDSTSNYPVNDTSVFYLVQPVIYYAPGGSVSGGMNTELSFYFKTDSDSLNDFGTLEASRDSGVTWVNVRNNPSMYCMIHDLTTWDIYAADTGAFTGESNGWFLFTVNSGGWGYTGSLVDTITYRFTFISDSVETNQEGWMIDWINYNQYLFSIDEFQRNDFRSSIFPNPASTEVKFSFERNSEVTLTILNTLGQVLLEYDNLNSNERVDLSSISSDIYFYTLVDRENKTSSGRLILAK
jgi:hypothetical protein